jgi:hypothetical protein
MRRDVGTPERDSAIRLPDGRRHAYAEWGDPNGRPVLYFHGMPPSRGSARFGAVGWSAGVSYALACAALIAERLTGVAVTTSNAALA